MVFAVSESWRCIINADQVFEGMPEISEMNTALLMSLLDDSQGDLEADGDRLSSIIQSLEEEIHPELTMTIPQEYDQSQEFDWMDMEVMMPSNYNHNHITNCYKDLCHDGDHEEMDGTIQYSQLNWDAHCLEDNDQCNYLWDV